MNPKRHPAENEALTAPLVFGGLERDTIFHVILSANQLLRCSPERKAVCSAEKKGAGLSVACHAGVLNMTAVGFAPAGELALVDGVFGPDTRHVVHPDQASTYRKTQDV